VRIALALKGVDVEYQYVNLLKDEQREVAYKQANPQGYVPALVTDDDVTLTQSLAIIEYLDEVHPKPPLLPENPIERAYVRALANIIASDIHPLNNRGVLQYFEDELNIDSEQRKKWYHHWLKQGFDAFEAILAAHNLKGRFCFRDNPTIADLCLVPQVYNAWRFDFDMKAYPLINDIVVNCNSLKEFDIAAPHNQADAA